MDDESKQLLAAILSGLQEFRAETNARLDRLETKVDGLEKHAAKTDERFDRLEKPMLAIGFEVKEDVRNLLEKLDQLSIEVFTARADTTRNKVNLNESTRRVTALEERQSV